MDKRSESQFTDINSIDIPEGVDWRWTAESQDELAQEEAKKRHKIMPLSRNGEDIENSKRSRGERL